MSTTLAFLLDQRGTQQQLGAHVAALAFDATGQAGFALADGTLRIVADRDSPWRTIELLDGAILDLASDCSGPGFIVGDDGGAFSRIGDNDAATLLHRVKGKWIEHVARFTHPRDGVLACSAGKKLFLFDARGRLFKELEHPSTVTGITFDAKGKRVAASHYNGVSIWYVASKTDNPRRLDWKGSHTGIALHPAGDAVVTSMQENSLHGWRLADGQHMRMSGYPAKTESLSFSKNGKWLASSGADAVVLWPFFGGGPMGKAPMELAGGHDILCTRVACHPQHEAVAAGFADGMVVLVDLNSQRLLPVAPGAHGAVTALAWSNDGGKLAFGTETGFAALMDFGA